MKLRRYVVKCEGITPLLMDRMSSETLEELRTGNRAVIDKTRSKEEICKGKIYRDEEGRIALPVQNIFAAMNGGARFIQYDTKRKLATASSTLLPLVMEILDGEFVLLEGNLEWKPDERRGRLPNGPAISIVRPKFNDWGFTISLEIDEDEGIKFDKIREVLHKAGRAQGLCAFRPECKGNFGKFRIVSTEEVPIPA